MFNGTNCEYLMRGRELESHIWKEKDVDMERESETVRVICTVTLEWCSSSHSMQTVLLSRLSKDTVPCVCVSWGSVCFSRTLLLSYSSCPLFRSYVLIIIPPVRSIWHHVGANLNKILICHIVLDRDRGCWSLLLRGLICHKKSMNKSVGLQRTI